jgi:uracil-DNA glycosylase family 4
MTKLIQQVNWDAKVMIVGESPGATEVVTGVPFSGGSGELLNRMLERAGIARRDCFITNLAHIQPPGNKFDWFLKGGRVHPTLAEGVAQLSADIERLQPNLILAMGAEPLRFSTGKNGISKWRGSILEHSWKVNPATGKGYKVIATYHPAAILRIYDYKAVADFDLIKAARERHFPEIIRPKRNFYLDPPQHERVALLEEMLCAEWLSVDIECTKRDSGTWALSCIGFSDCPDRALVIPFGSAGANGDIARALSHPIRKVMQNGTFDTTVLRQEGFVVNNFAYDTMLGHHSLYTECAGGGDELSSMSGKKRQAAIAKGLGFQTSIYTDEPFYKDDGKVWQETNDLQLFWRYNALDAMVTREIQLVQQKEIKEFGVECVLEHEMSLVEPLMEMTRVGMRVDMKHREFLRTKISQEIVNLQKLVDYAAGGSLNVKSSPQVQELLYGKLGLPIKRNRKSGNPSADKDAIAELAKSSNHPVLHAIIQVRERRDLIERYLNAAVDADGRMRCNFDITGTRTGRLSSRASIYGSGTNLQNQPDEIRRMFIPDDGKIFVYRDYSQAEARVVAYYAEEQALIDLFEDPNRDVHKENAARIFRKNIADVTHNERYLAKRVIHASNYGMLAPRLYDVVNQDAATTGVRITISQARQLLDAYFMLYPKVREVFWKDVENELRATRTLTTPFGRKRIFFGRWEDKFLKEAYAFKPQSTIGDLCCKALVNMHRTKNDTWDILVNVHDSILVQCPVDDASIVAKWMKEQMDIPFEIKGKRVYVPTDCKVGYNWQDANLKAEDEYDRNERGLVKFDG